MNKLVRLLDRKSAVAFVIAGCAVAFLAGCSSDVSGLSNPFADSARLGGGTDRMATGSLAPPASIGEAAPVQPLAQGAPVGAVASAPLAPVRPATSNDWAQSAAAPAQSSAAAYIPPSVRHDHAVYEASHGQWAADGGTYVTVRPGENAATLAKRYDVPLEALIRVNGLVSAAQIHPGSRVVIPVYTAASALRGARRDTASRRPPSRDVSEARNEGHGRTVYHFVRGPAPAGDRDDADASSRRGKEDRRTAQNKRDDRRAAPEQQVARATPEVVPAPAHKAPTDRASTGSLPLESVASAAKPDFSWPARGRIIEGFRPGVNDGINIALPDGTNVRAVDDGVVAYAGDELKGYGDLVLIRHPNGFVSAYADNGALEVHRGETVTRGEVIAKSGQSGNVASPQLHFELRKGQTPVNPTQYLAGL